MRVTIIKDDNVVYVDGLALHVDCSPLPAEFHALQWYDTHGEIEFKTIDGQRAPNAAISDLAPYRSFVDGWNLEKAKVDAAEAAARAAAPPIKTTAKGAVNVIA